VPSLIYAICSEIGSPPGAVTEEAFPLAPANFSLRSFPALNRSNCKKATAPPVLILSSIKFTDLGIKSRGSEMRPALLRASIGRGLRC
jgi:hypothetical protein